MFGYYLGLALQSLKRSPGITALMVLSIGVGVALAMTSWTLEHSMTRDPIPRKSAVLFVPTIDAWGPAALKKLGYGDELPGMLDYATVKALLRDHRAKFQSPAYWLSPTIVPKRIGEHPFTTYGYAVSGEFFPMADIPFKYGSGWSNADDKARAQVVVISQKLNDKVFGGDDSVGKALSVDGHDFRVVGVMKYWNPQPVYFAVPESPAYSIYRTNLLLPFNTAIAAKISSSGNTNCLPRSNPSGFDGLLRSNCLWLSYMVQLDTPAAVRRYEDYLKGFAAKRFAWPPHIRLRDLMAWLHYQQVAPSGMKILQLVGIGLLIVCMVDTIGLMLAKFLRRSGEIGVRRALGAPRSAIYAQFLTEGALIGVAGGLFGILLTWLATLWVQAKYPKNWSGIAPHLDVGLLALTLVVAIVATLLAALYPVWRAAHIQPAWQLKEH